MGAGKEPTPTWRKPGFRSRASHVIDSALGRPIYDPRDSGAAKLDAAIKVAEAPRFGRRSKAALVSPPRGGTNRLDWLETQGFQPLSAEQHANAADRSEEQQDNQEKALRLYYNASILKGLHRLKVSYTVGSARINIQCRDPRSQVIVDAMAADPVNTILSQPWIDAIRLRLFGEYAAAVQVRRNGIIRLHWMHPYSVRKVWYYRGNDTFPDYVLVERSLPGHGPIPFAGDSSLNLARTPEMLDGLGLVATGATGPRLSFDGGTAPDYIGQAAAIGGKHAGVWRAVGLRDPEHSWRSHIDMAQWNMDPLYDGDMLYFRANWEGASRGVADYSDVFDDVAKEKSMTGEEQERVSRLKDYLYKYRFTGTVSTQLKTMMEEEWEPRPGTVVWLNGTKDECDIEAVSPSIGASETAAFFKWMKSKILQTDNIPPSWFSEDEANRATALAQEEPALKRYELSQAEYRAFIVLFVNAGLSAAKAHGALDLDADVRFDVFLPELRPDEMTEHVKSSGDLRLLLSDAVKDGFLDRRQAAAIFQAFIAKKAITSKDELEGVAAGKTRIALPANMTEFGVAATAVATAVDAGLKRALGIKILHRAAVQSGALTQEEIDRIAGPEATWGEDGASAPTALTESIGRSASNGVMRSISRLIGSDADRVAKALPGVRALNGNGGLFTRDELRSQVKGLPVVKRERHFDGTPVVLRCALTPEEREEYRSGRIAEEIVLRHYVGARRANERPNDPIDIVWQDRAIEVKGGLVSNASQAQQWRMTIGEPGKEEAAALARMTAEEKADWNADKQEEIRRRKMDAVARLSREYGRALRPMTITLVMDPDSGLADIHEFDGFHDRIGWTSEAAAVGYRETVKYAEAREAVPVG